MATPDRADHEYVLGTNAVEVRRLFEQHYAWRPYMFSAWRRAGFHPGQTLLDVGCGPGAATLDLAELVGPGGRVIAIDQSQAFLDSLDAAAKARRIDHIELRREDLLEWDGGAELDGAWCRWLFSFLRDPARLAHSLGRCCRPGGRLVIHEYYDYAAWRMYPRLPELEQFVDTVMRSWRDMGGEPNVALALPQLLTDAGFDIVEQRPIAQILTRDDHAWTWLAGFVTTGTERLCGLGYLSATESANIAQAFGRAAAQPGTRMTAPSVLEIIAMKRR